MKKLFFALIFLSFALPALGAWDDPRQEAAVALMTRCEEVLWRAKLERCPDFDERFDPEHSGLVGVDVSPIVTTAGHWRDKLVCARPSMAGAVTGYFIAAGVRSGDVVAINTSSSYPGFLLAALCAVQALDARAVLICSYGSSTYGTTLPEFTVPVMLDCLNAAGLLEQKIAALSPGGAEDGMYNALFEEGRQIVLDLMAQRSERLLLGTFDENMAVRREIFFSQPLKVFVNCGGSMSSIGTDDEAPVLPHGLFTKKDFPQAAKYRGLVFEALERGLPVIHLLYTAGICKDYGLPCEKMDDPESEYDGE